MKFLSIVNWEKYQRYKGRRPPWIKLYNSLLDDYEFTQLPDSTRLQLLLLFLLASKHENKIPANPKWLQKAMQMDSKIDLESLVSAGFIVMAQDAHDLHTSGAQKGASRARLRSASASLSDSVSSLSLEGECEGEKTPASMSDDEYAKWAKQEADAYLEKADKAAWPLVDVKKERTKALNWLFAQGKAKRKKRMGQFLSGWLNRSQDQAEKSGAAPPANPTDTSYEMDLSMPQATLKGEEHDA